jgi:phage shock protein A
MQNKLFNFLKNNAMNIFKRIMKIGQAEAHSAIDKAEDPIVMSEQAIRDLRSDLDKCLEALAQVKAMSIRARNEAEEYTGKAEDYGQKAMMLLVKAQSGDMPAADADRLAKEALIKKAEAEGQVKRSLGEKEKFDLSVAQMDANITTLKQNISKWENELKTLRARVKVADATKDLNKQLSQMDSSGTVGTLERMRDKVVQKEALAEAYGEMANTTKSIDSEIDKAIDLRGVKADSELAALKQKLGIN